MTGHPGLYARRLQGASFSEWQDGHLAVVKVVAWGARRLKPQRKLCIGLLKLKKCWECVHGSKLANAAG